MSLHFNCCCSKDLEFFFFPVVCVKLQSQKTFVLFTMLFKQSIMSCCLYVLLRCLNLLGIHKLDIPRLSCLQDPFWDIFPRNTFQIRPHAKLKIKLCPWFLMRAHVLVQIWNVGPLGSSQISYLSRNNPGKRDIELLKLLCLVWRAQCSQDMERVGV